MRTCALPRLDGGLHSPYCRLRHSGVAHAALNDEAVALPSPVALPCEQRVRVRRGGWQDIEIVSRTCADAFADVPGAIPGLDSAIDGLGLFMTERYTAAQAREIVKAFSLSLSRKEEARREARLPSSAATSRRLRRLRQFTCLVAHEGNEIVGCAFLSWLVLEAPLPPPFPSSKPYELVVSNVSVARKHRRRGVGSALLNAALRLASRWGDASALWLEVDAQNTGARALYIAAGFVEQPPAFSLWPWGSRKVLMKRDVNR